MLRVVFEKTGRARYISHLDLMRTFQRALFRAGIPIWHTEGFHTHAYVSIALPLSVGFGSQCEILEFRLTEEDYPTETIPAALNAALPEGICAISCAEGVQPLKRLAWVDYEITLGYDAGVPEGAAAELAALLGRESLVMRKKSKKAKAGFTEVDLIPLIDGLTYTTEENKLVLRGLLRAQNPGLNPELIVAAVREHLPHITPDRTGFVRLAVYNEEKQPFL